MKFLQKILHLTLIVSIFLAPMDFSWAMEEEGSHSSRVQVNPHKDREKGKEKEKRSKKKTKKDTELSEEDFSSTDSSGEDIVGTDEKYSLFGNEQEEFLRDAAAGVVRPEQAEMILETIKAKLKQRRARPSGLPIETLTPEQKKFRTALRKLGISSVETVLIYGSGIAAPESPLSIEDIAKSQKNAPRSGKPKSWGSTDLFFKVLDEEFWLKHISTTWKTKSLQILMGLLGFGPPSAFTAMIMFEVGYFFNFQDLDGPADACITWFTVTLSPPLVRHLYEKGKTIGQAVFREKAFHPTEKEDSKPHIYKLSLGHKIVKGGVIVGAFLNSAGYVTFLGIDVENLVSPPISFDDITFTAITGTCLFVSLGFLFYDLAQKSLYRQFREHNYEKSASVRIKRQILLDKTKEVQSAIHQPNSEQFINTLFELIVNKLKKLKGEGTHLQSEPENDDIVVALTSLLFKNSNRVSIPKHDSEDIPPPAGGLKELNSLLEEAEETQELFTKAKNFQADLDETYQSSWWKEALGIFGNLVAGARIYTQYRMMNHIADLIAWALGIDKNFSEPVAYVVLAFVTGSKTLVEHDVIKNWFQSLPSLFSFKQDMVGLRKVGKGISLVNAAALSMVELVIAEFAYPDLDLFSKIILFGSNTIGTTAVFDTFLSEKTDNLITGIFTLDYFQKIKNYRIRRVFINYWLDQFREILEKLDDESIQVIYSKTQDAA